jgi:hypothetical protein
MLFRNYSVILNRQILSSLHPKQSLRIPRQTCLDFIEEQAAASAKIGGNENGGIIICLNTGVPET